MKIHICYFCNYKTKYSTSFKDHIMKQNKCSYLIKSIPINSIEDYYKIRDLHKENPDNSIFGEDPDVPPPKYYNSDDDESNWDDQVKVKIQNNIKYVEKLKDKYINKKNNFTCNYCNNNFSRKDHLKRHLNGRCKILKQQQKELEDGKKQMELAEEKYKQTMKELENKELQDQILLLKSLMDQQQKENEEKNRIMKQEMEEQFKKEIKLLKENKDNTINNTTNNIYNTDNSITNNIEQQQIANEINNIKNEVKNQIIINNFGNENKDLFNDEERMLSWIEKPFNAIPHMVEKLHFTPNKRPENTNIRIANIGNGKAQIYKYGEWKTIMKHELICDLINECAQKLIDTYEIYVKEGKIERMTRFEKFMKQYESDDTFFVKSQNEKVDCKLIDLMKKHKTYLNSLE